MTIEQILAKIENTLRERHEEQSAWRARQNKQY